MYNVTASEELEVRVSRLQETVRKGKPSDKKVTRRGWEAKESVQITDSYKSLCGIKRVQEKKTDF